MEHFKLQFLMMVLLYLGPANAVETCDAAVDLGFIVDSSSTAKNEFPIYIKGFMIKAAKRYRFSPTDGFQAGVVLFGRSSEVAIYFDSTDNYRSFRERVENLTSSSADKTRIDLAFEKAKSMLFQTSRGYRGGLEAGFPAYALLISDGSQNPWSNPPGQNKDAALENAYALKSRGIDIIAFGLINTKSHYSWRLHEQLLKDMASPGLYYRVRGVTDMTNHLDELVGTTCKGRYRQACVEDGSDAVLVVDTSNRATYLNQEREISKRIVKYYNVKRGGNKVGLVSYGSIATSAGYYQDTGTFSQKLDFLSIKGGAPHIDLALGEAAVMLRSSLAKNKSLYLFADGFLEDSLNPTRAIATADSLRESGVKIIIVAMGTNPNMPFLRLLTDEGKIVRAPSGKIPAKKAVQISCKAQAPQCYTVLKEKLKYITTC